MHAPRRIDFSIGESTRRTWFDYDDVGRMTRVCTNNSDNDPRVCSAEKPENDRRPELLSNRAMTWDAEGRLTRVRGVLDSSIPQNAELMLEDYVYDASGNRTLKIHRPPRTDDLPEGARESATIYMMPYYARPYDRRGSVQVSLGTLPAVSMTAPADPSEEPRATFLYSDLPVGSMTAAVTVFGEPIQANATLIARREYSPYGLELTVDELAQTGREGVAPISVFHGKELDRLTKFSSFGARYYSRDLGIWLKPDPILASLVQRGYTPTSGDFNAYGFVDQSPTGRLDSDGHKAVAIAAFKSGHRDTGAFESRVFRFHLDAHATVHTGDEFISKLAQLSSRTDPIERLVVASHGSGSALYMNDKAGLYEDVENMLGNFIYEKQWPWPGRGAATLSDLGKKVRSGEIIFAKGCTIVLLGCTTSRHPLHLDSFAKTMSEQIPDAYVIGATEHSKPDVKSRGVNSNKYRADPPGGHWEIWKGGQMVGTIKNPLDPTAVRVQDHLNRGN